MTTIEVPGRGPERPGGTALLARVRASRRVELEALGLLVGVLGILLVVVATVGSASPFGP